MVKGLRLRGQWVKVKGLRNWGSGVGVMRSRLRGQGVKGIALDRQLPYRTVFGRGRAGM